MTSREELESLLIQRSSDRCESPIEKSFFVAYANWIRQGEREWAVDRPSLDVFLSTPPTRRYTFLHHAGFDVVWIQPQIGRFRPDFVVGRIAYDLDWTLDDGKGVEVLRRLPLIAVECDGHDFHERTKEQAQRDKSRDRELIAEGYRVIRFTGSEIYRDPDACAKEVDTIFGCLLNPELARISQGQTEDRD